MTHQPFSFPPIQPFERLHIYDSLMMNARRWLLAHEYHRRRQNVHYQSLNQPGIVWGLGVRLIDPPAEAPARFRDRRWIEIQPGIAIDLQGNPIVVDQSINRELRVATEAPIAETVTVYLVVSYVEPQNPEQPQSSEVVREWFRFDEKTTPPNEKEIELCRIKLQPGTVQLEKPADVLFPEANQLDFRFRTQAQARPQAIVRVAQITPDYPDEWDRRDHDNLSYLMKAVAALYPALQEAGKVDQVTLQAKEIGAGYDLLYVALTTFQELDERERESLIEYLESGGVILVEAPTDREVPESFTTFIAQHLDGSSQLWQKLSRNDSLRTEPFLFAALPIINQDSIEIWNGGGIILVMGELSTAWGLDDQLSLSRNDIRTAQELGINILHFGWRRRQLTQLLQ